MSDRRRRKPDPLDEDDDLLAPEGDEPGDAGGAFVDEEPEPPPTPLDDAPAGEDGAVPHDAPAEPADRRDWSVPVSPAWSEEAAWEDEEDDLLADDDALDDLPDPFAGDGADAAWEAEEADDEDGLTEDEPADDELAEDGGEPDEAAWAVLEAELPVVGWREAVDLPELGLVGVPAVCDPSRPDSWARLPDGAGVREGEPVELRLAGRAVRIALAVRRDPGPVEVRLGRDALAGRFLVDPSRDGQG